MEQIKASSFRVTILMDLIRFRKRNNLLSHMTSLLTSNSAATDDILCTILIAPHVSAPSALLSKLHEALRNKLRSQDISNETQLYTYTLLVEAQLRIDPTQVELDSTLKVLQSSMNDVSYCPILTLEAFLYIHV